MEIVSRACLIVVLALGLGVSGCKQPDATPTHVGQNFDRVVVVVLQSANFDDADKDPYLHALEAKGTTLSNYHAVTHPAYPNALALVGGKRFETILDTQMDIDGDGSIADLLEAKKLTWKSYADDYPGNCFLGDSSGGYARRHVPLLSFTAIQKDPARCARVVAGTQLAADFEARRLPNYSYVSPSLVDDGVSTSVSLASGWLRAFLEPLLADPEGMKGLLVAVTFDEASDYVGDNQVYTLLLGPMVGTGAVDDTAYDHFSLVRTIETNFGLGRLATEDATAHEITGAWAVPSAK